MSNEEKISRRSWLTSAAIFTTAVGMAPLLSSVSVAEGKVAKSVVHYQDHPKEMQMCGMCKYFISGTGRHSDSSSGMGGGMMMGAGMMREGMMETGKCLLVAGRISPMGYCSLYAPRRE
ncbi:MAG: hypothetical protein ACYC5H_04660 [Methylovirgula sp.]